MTAAEKRNLVLSKYESILRRNNYNQSLRDYCFKMYKDGKYYSDCSSSISYCYKEAGFSFGILNTVGMYQNKNFTTVDVEIKNGQITDVTVGNLRVGDMLLYSGSDNGRAYAGYVGHVEIVAKVGKTTKDTIIYGHGSGTPSQKILFTYCNTRINMKTKTPIGDRRLIKVVRFIQDDKPTVTTTPSKPKTTTKTLTYTKAAFVKDVDAVLKGKIILVSKQANNKHTVVKYIQKYLNSLGYNCGEVDGIFGNNTKNAVMKWQKDNKLVVDGIIGVKSWKKLLS